MYLNQAALDLTQTTELDYRRWCQDNRRAMHKTETKREYFWKIMTGRLVKDENGKLVKKRAKRK